VFYLAYHLHWSAGDIAALDLSERREFVRMLAMRIEAENVAIEALGQRNRGRAR
jgi:hypothetical protein